MQIEHIGQPLEEEAEEHLSSKGSYVLNALYIVLFFIGYLWAFWELSQRWAVH